MNSPVTREAPPGLIAHVHKKRLFMMIGIALAGYLVMYFFLDPGRVYLIVMGMIVAIVAAYSLKEFFKNDAKVIIDRRGILDKRLGMGTIAWPDITRVYVASYQNIDHVCLELADENKYLKKRSAVAKAALKFHRAANNISPFNINTGVLDVGTSEIVEAIVECREFYSLARDRGKTE